jgi:hypothetical protein
MSSPKYEPEIKRHITAGCPLWQMFFSCGPRLPFNNWCRFVWHQSLVYVAVKACWIAVNLPKNKEFYAEERPPARMLDKGFTKC